MFNGMKYVYEVYKERSFSNAARNLYISQPALSGMIKKIEKNIGMPLFDRSTTPIQLTECGKKYIKTAEKIMSLEDEFAYYVGKLDELKTGRLTVGSTYLFSSFVLPKYIKKFKASYPDVKVSLFEGNSNLLEKKLANGELDFVVDNYLLDEKVYDRISMMKERLLLAVPASFSSNRRASTYQLTVNDIINDVHLNPSFPAVPLKKFQDEPFMVMRQNNDTRDRVEAIYKRANISLNVTLELNQLMTVYHLLKFELGASFVSDTIVKCFPSNDTVLYYKLDDLAAVRDVYLFYRRNRYLTRSMEEFMKIVLEEQPEEVII
ncbi:Cyn operon transcriptional activator [Blautia hydrogenotrophica]|uniref:LysR family transcriptional regulator n=1 Tax=Blautia hydrogenotrophica TaxID=53443 RepID=UPI0006C28182|nr:LysR family transcriptional regulator [Blautia hydrogenotrophica]CUN07690.1 Cyn operon transcriptional activator [Blautia hydrogenotrophica]SCI05493.1 Cyn operon transcriptional activator [uncultured Blautia sp.]